MNLNVTCVLLLCDVVEYHLNSPKANMYLCIYCLVTVNSDSAIISL